MVDGLSKQVALCTISCYYLQMTNAKVAAKRCDRSIQWLIKVSSTVHAYFIWLLRHSREDTVEPVIYDTLYYTLQSKIEPYYTILS